MATNQRLLEELIQLRQYLKNQGKQREGRTPLICNDEALNAIAEFCPKKVNDLKGIPGVGNTFIERYGELFVNVVLKYCTTDNEKTVTIGRNTSEILKELEKKLVSINRRNRLLYMPKIAYKYAHDLVREDYITPLQKFFLGKPIVLSDLARDSGNGNEQKRYKNMVTLLREVNKDLREKGQNDLYLAYPFVIGRMAGENFDVRAPLALFPVTTERTPSTISITLDDTRDALYNNTLLLAYFKFNHINQPLPINTIDDYTLENLIPKILTFYEDNQIKIEAGMEEEPRLFETYNNSTFPKFQSGELFLDNHVVLGKFPICSGSIQKDFDEMLTSGKINTMLNELLLDVNDYDYESDAYANQKELDKKYPISEKELVYINELDSSQENVLAAINHLDQMVIQGPPGTGKSQTITSLIAEFVNQEKTVLMVSEKKTALDVVYSRLGTLSKYALIIDDVANKELFYEQLSKMSYLGRESNDNVVSLDAMAQEIDRKVEKLENIAKNLYRMGSFGIEPYKVYLESKPLDVSTQEQLDKVNVLHQAMTIDLMSMKYEELEHLHHQFSDSDVIEKINFYSTTREKFSWLEVTKCNMNEFDLLQLRQELDGLETLYKEYMDKNWLLRLVTKGKWKKTALDVISKYFVNVDKNVLNTLVRNISWLKDGFQYYREYDSARPIYAKLSPTGRLYYQTLVRVKNRYEDSIILANEALYQQILHEHIQRFEMEHKQLFEDINNYASIIWSLSDAIAKKKELTRQRLEQLLAHSMGNITFAKRKGEIQRVIESKRKWSVNRFISTFSFELFHGVKIWLLTPEVVSEIIPLETGVFDLVIFDEASQMYVEKGIPAIYRAKKVVIAGDQKQLRPSSLGSGRMEIDEEDLEEDVEVTAALEEESLLDLARFKYEDVMLNFHYRSRYEELIAFSNYAFYQGRLHISPNVDEPETPPIQVHKMEDALWKNRSNLVEAKYVIDLLKNILKNRTLDETIGIITFNISQRDMIEDLLDEECAKDAEFATTIRAEFARMRNGEDIGLFIKNIESVQGDERDIIIFSVGYAKNESGKLVRNFGWLNQSGGENRLNVAISRAKQKIHIITSFEPEELQVNDMKNDGPKIFKKYLQYAKAVSSKDSKAAKQILGSFGDSQTTQQNPIIDDEFETHVYQALCNRLEPMGFTVETQVGIGGYSIDLAIRKDSKYVLGIEYDGRTYQMIKSARERDYHRQKYLESRGWRMYRIWSMNWLKNQEKEMDQIIQLLEAMKAS